MDEAEHITQLDKELYNNKTYIFLERIVTHEEKRIAYDSDS